MSDEETGNSEIPVEFDMSFSTNTRINYLLWKYNGCSEEGNADGWFQNCKNIYKELSVKMSDPETESAEESKTKCQKDLNEFISYNTNYQRNHEKIPVYMPPSAIFESLFRWEIELRKKAQKLKLLFKEGEDINSSM